MGTLKHRILDHEFEFVSLTHLEDPGYAHPKETLIRSLRFANGHPLGRPEAEAILDRLSDKVISYLWFMYQNEMDHGHFEAQLPYTAPEPHLLERTDLGEEEDDGQQES